MLRPPHEPGCTCEWCNAITVARRRQQRGWTPIPLREPDADHRQEAPNEKPFVPVVRIDEVANARNRKLKKRARSQHPSTLPEVSDLLPKPVFDHKPMDYFPSYESVVALAAQFPRVERPKPKSSGCWWCEDEQRHDDLCDVCTNLLADYKAYLDQRPVVEI